MPREKANMEKKMHSKFKRTNSSNSSRLSISNRQLATTSLILKIADSNVPRLRPNIHQNILDLKLVATLLDTRLPSAPKKCLNAVWKDALSAFLTMRVAFSSVLTN